MARTRTIADIATDTTGIPASLSIPLAQQFEPFQARQKRLAVTEGGVDAGASENASAIAAKMDEVRKNILKATDERDNSVGVASFNAARKLEGLTAQSNSLQAALKNLT